MEPTDSGTTETPTQAQLVAALNAKLLREQNLPLAIVAGAVMALIGALVWMGITLTTQMHLGIVAIGVGAAIGFAVRYAGRGVTKIYGAIGAAFTLLSCLAGEIFTVVQATASGNNTNFFAVLSQVDLGKMTGLILENSSAISYFIYAIGIYEGYKFSFRKLTAQELQDAGLAQPAQTSSR